MSILSEMRRQGVTITLDPANPNNLIVDEASESQVREIAHYKHIIRLALRAEGFIGGQSIAHSALSAGIERTHKQAKAQEWAAPREVGRLLDILDEILGPWDQQHGLKTALVIYMERLPEMRRLVAEINRAGSMALTGPDLESSARWVFRQQRRLDSEGYPPTPVATKIDVGRFA